MEPLSEKELIQLLRQWEAPATPSSLRSPVSKPRQSRWRWLWSGRIHIPVPACAAALIVAAGAWLYMKPVPQSAPADIINTIRTPVVPTKPPSVNSIAGSARTASPKPSTADSQSLPRPALRSPEGPLAGFRPVSQIQPQIVEVQK